MSEPDSEEARYRAVLALSAGAPDYVAALARAMADESWRVRKAATERLVHAPGRPDAVRTLIATLGERGQTGARNASAGALARMGEDAAPAVIALLRHADPDQRTFAAEILGELGSAAAAKALLGTLEDPDPNVRLAGVEALGRAGGEEAARALNHVLRSPEPLLALAALEALYGLASPPALPVLAHLSQVPALRRSACRLLGLVPDAGAAEILCTVLVTDVSAAREVALGALAQLRRAADDSLRRNVERMFAAALHRLHPAAEWVQTALASSEVGVREGALWAAGVLGDPALATVVAEAAQDDALFEPAIDALEALGTPGVRAAAGKLAELSGPARAAVAEALVRVADPPLVPLIASLVAEGDPDVRVPVLRALGKAQSLDALEPLVALLGDPEHAAAAAAALLHLAASYAWEVRQRLEREISARPSPAAIRALAALGGADASGVLKRTARDPDPRVRAASVEASGRLGAADPKSAAWASDVIRLALADEGPLVRAAAARALGRLGAPGGAKLLRPLMADPDLGVRVAALEAAGEAGLTELAAELRPAVGDPAGACAAAAVAALAKLGRLDAEALEQAARHPDPEVVKEALRCGAALDFAVPLARRHLTHPRWDVRLAAARTLGSSGGTDSIAEVEAALAREQNAVARDALREAAERLARR